MLSLYPEIKLLIILPLDYLSTIALSLTCKEFFQLCDASWNVKAEWLFGCSVTHPKYMMRRMSNYGTPRAYDPKRREFVNIGNLGERQDIVTFESREFSGAVWTLSITSTGTCLIRENDREYIIPKVYAAVMNHDDPSFVAVLLTDELVVFRIEDEKIVWLFRTEMTVTIRYVLNVYIIPVDDNSIVTYVTEDSAVMRTTIGENGAIHGCLMNDVVDLYYHVGYCFATRDTWGILTSLNATMMNRQNGSVKKYLGHFGYRDDYILVDSPIAVQTVTCFLTATTRTLTLVDNGHALAELRHNGDLLVFFNNGEKRTIDTGVIAMYDHSWTDFVSYLVSRPIPHGH